jgi:hypothetical protein
LGGLTNEADYLVFDLYSQHLDTGAQAQSANGKIALWRELLVYDACLIDIFIAPAFGGVLDGHYPAVAGLFRGWPHVWRLWTNGNIWRVPVRGLASS